MKVMQINCVYKKGSTGKIVYDIHSGMQDSGEESVVCYGRGDRYREKNVYKICTELYSKWNNLGSRISGVMYGGCFISTNALFQIIKKVNPDVIHIHCINGYFVNIYRLISFIKKRKIKTLLTLHAEFMYTGNCGHSFDCQKWETGCGKCPRYKKETKSFYLDNTALSWNKMKKAFDGFDDNLIVSSVSPWLQERAQRSPILRNKNHTMILNGIDTRVFCVRQNGSLKSKLGIEDKKVVLHVTASFSTDKSHIKGGYYVLKMARRFFESSSDIVFLVAGQHGEISDIPPNIIFLGNISDQNKLAEYYSMADLTLLTSKKETFSMIVAESLCCGTPVVGFEAGAPEMITIKEYSSFISYGDEEKLFNQINLYLEDTSFDKSTISDAAKMRYGKDIMIERYRNVYNQLIKQRNQQS